MNGKLATSHVCCQKLRLYALNNQTHTNKENKGSDSLVAILNIYEDINLNIIASVNGSILG